MESVYEICAGMDVHKKFIVATIIKNGARGPVYLRGKFSTFNSELLKLKQWLLDNDCRDVCMEATGKYWVPVFNVLEDEIRVTVANPKWVRAIQGRKDDVKDSKWIADLFRMGLVGKSFIPPKDIRILREYTRYIVKVVQTRSSERRRYQNAFTVCNIALDSVVKDMNGVFAQRVLHYVMETSAAKFDEKYCLSLRTIGMKASDEEIIESIRGYNIDDSQKPRIHLIEQHMKYIDTIILPNLHEQVDEIVAPYESQIELLTTIPGVSRHSAISILAEIGVDMSMFGSANRMASWAGLVPMNNESAGKKKTTRTSGAGAYIKPILVQVANVAVRMKRNPYYRVKFQRIMSRRGKKRALIAIARMMLVAIYHMLKNGEVFNPCDYEQIIAMSKETENQNEEERLDQKKEEDKKSTFEEIKIRIT